MTRHDSAAENKNLRTPRPRLSSSPPETGAPPPDAMRTTSGTPNHHPPRHIDVAEAPEMGRKGFGWRSKAGVVPSRRNTLHGSGIVDGAKEELQNHEALGTLGMNSCDSEPAGKRMVVARNQGLVIRLGRFERLVYGSAFVAHVDWGVERRKMEKRSEIGYENEATQCKQMLQRAIPSTKSCASCFVNLGVCLCNLQRLRCKLTQEPRTGHKPEMNTK
jgi:hypothetical protein